MGEHSLKHMNDTSDGHRKQEATMQVQIQNLQSELSQTERRAQTEERRAEKLANARPPEEKELRSLRQTVQDLRDQLNTARSDIRRFSSNVVSFGEFQRMQKDAEAK